MRTATHEQHIRSLTSHNSCQECRADCERRFAPRDGWPGYRFVHEYLELARAGFAGAGVRLWRGEDRLNAEEFAREFSSALQRRIYLRADPPRGRKYSPGYLERLRQFRFPESKADAGYLRRFAKRGASTLGG